MTLVQPPVHTGTLESVLNAARRRIEVSDEELKEARNRRAAIGAALRREFAGSRIYVNGSVAHGDALTPLADVDLGCVVADPDHTYGPGRVGSRPLKDRAANAIRRELREQYGDLRVEVEGRKRSILVRFRDPVRPGLPDFTADVIVAIDNPDGDGLFIPRFEGWDRSDPEKHTELVREANLRTRSGFARNVRLIKHWSRTHDKPLCSWNIKALSLPSITQPTTLLAGVHAWFKFAIADLTRGETEDPAHVAPHPIKIPDNWKRPEVVSELRQGLEMLERAIQFEQEGYKTAAVDALARLFNDADMLPFPDQATVREELAERTRALRDAQTKVFGSPALLTSATTSRERTNVQSWSA